MRLAVPVIALSLAGAVALTALPGVLRAEDSTRDAVERLMPQLLSDDDVVRGDAEKQLFAMGEPGKKEVERLTRDSDPKRAITALRLLGSRNWSKTPRPTAKDDGEERVHKDGDRDVVGGRVLDLDELQRRIDRQMEEFRKQFDGWDKQFDGKGFTWATPGVELQLGGGHGRSNGSVLENDKKTEWTVEEDGSVKVTIQDGKDAPEQKFEAKSMDELKKEHPDVAKRLEPLMGKGGRRAFALRLGKPGEGFVLRGDGDRNPYLLGARQTQVLGVAWSPVPDVLREQLDLAAGGMVVEDVVPDTLAAKLGLAKYDVLVEIQGKPVEGSPDVRKALEDVKAGDAVKAVVVRKGQRRVLEATK